MTVTGQAEDIRLHNVSKSFGRGQVIDGLSATLRAGEFTVILGPSGSGKTTLLNMIAGLETVDDGRIHFGEVEVQDLPATKRGCAMVFQSYALYPHMTVGRNIGYPLEVAGVKKPLRVRRVEAAAQQVGLEDCLDRRPSELSGGQRQRVALARAIVREPKVLLLDEPLSNLDARLRRAMRRELRELHTRIGATTVLVTHDQTEAMTLADRIMILNNGHIEQFDTPAAVYARPATTFAAEFLGAPPMNLIEVSGVAGQLRIASGESLGPSDYIGPMLLGIRPERIVLDPAGARAKVLYREDLGSHSVIVARLSDGQLVHVALHYARAEAPGDVVGLSWPDTACQYFSLEAGRSLPPTSMEGREQVAEAIVTALNPGEQAGKRSPK